jgi:hypothetical protein
LDQSIFRFFGVKIGIAQGERMVSASLSEAGSAAR